MLYCEDCKTAYDTPRCPRCGNRRGREPLSDDICFLTETEQIWSEMLSDVLEQNSIAHLKKNLLGAGLTVTLGSGCERVAFYVKYKDLPAAQAITEELFESPVSEGDFPEECFEEE